MSKIEQIICTYIYPGSLISNYHLYCLSLSLSYLFSLPRIHIIFLICPFRLLTLRVPFFFNSFFYQNSASESTNHWEFSIGSSNQLFELFLLLKLEHGHRVALREIIDGSSCNLPRNNNIKNRRIFHQITHFSRFLGQLWSLWIENNNFSPLNATLACHFASNVFHVVCFLCTKQELLISICYKFS